MANVIKYGLSNVYYAKLTSGTYATPVPITGAVNLSLSADGESTSVYADNIEAFTMVTNNGYSGDIEFLIIPDAFKSDILGEEVAGGVQFESAKTQPSEFALMFQFEGDQSAKRHLLYRCKCTRPNIESSTQTNTTEAKNETLSITVRPRNKADKYVKASVLDTTETHDIYEAWFSAVYEKAAV